MVSVFLSSSCHADVHSRIHFSDKVGLNELLDARNILIDSWALLVIGSAECMGRTLIGCNSPDHNRTDSGSKWCCKNNFSCFFCTVGGSGDGLSLLIFVSGSANVCEFNILIQRWKSTEKKTNVYINIWRTAEPHTHVIHNLTRGPYGTEKQWLQVLGGTHIRHWSQLNVIVTHKLEHFRWFVGPSVCGNVLNIEQYHQIHEWHE